MDLNTEGIKYIIDANVLIDYCNTDLGVLEVFSLEIGPIYIAADVLYEVNQLSRSAAKKHRFLIIEPDLDLMIEAAERRPGLSFEDNLTLLLAKKNRLCCITAEKPLRRYCQDENIPVIWGLEPMKFLVEGGHLSAIDALAVAKAIHETNPLFITIEILSNFTDQIHKLQSDT